MTALLPPGDSYEEILARFPEYEVLEDQAVRLHTEFVQGFASLPVRIGR